MNRLPLALLLACAIDPAPPEEDAHARQVPCVASMPGDPAGTAETSTTGCSTNPEVPSKLRSVTPILDGAFQDPHIPPLRTSADGRVAVNNKTVSGSAGFYLFAPEKIDTAFIDSQPGAHILADTEAVLVPRSTVSPLGGYAHMTVCDAGRDWGNAQTPNPYACPDEPGEDCYDLFTIAVVTSDPVPDNHIRLLSRRVTIRVRDPKTPDATLVPDFRWQEGYTTSPDIVANTMFEPMVTDDGHLLAGRIGTNGFTWTPPEGTDPTLDVYTDPQLVDLVYTVHPPGSSFGPCDVQGWADVRPPSFAPHDPWMFDAGEPRYGISVYPFRSSEGDLIQPGRAFQSSYPWIDRHGRNLFYSSNRATLFFNDNDGPGMTTRYPAACPPDHPAYDPTDPFNCPAPTAPNELSIYDETSITRGATVLGLWTHGKQVLLDDPILNNIDFGMRLNNEMHREISLYSDSSTRPAPLVRVGVGRDNSQLHDFPPGATINLNFLESAEHLFNANAALFPALPRDVVWTLNSGRGSAEVSFDDYLHPDAMVVSDMVPVIDAQGIHYDGFNIQPTNGAEVSTGPGWSAPEEVRVQNAATTLPHRWVVPPHGAVHGLARVEHIALGGVHGKGLWLQPDAGITYEIPAQPQSAAVRSWYTGLFVDPRASAGQLIGFPDGSSLALLAPDRLAYLAPDGQQLHEVLLHPDDALFEEEWTHLGLVTRAAGTDIDLYLDGYLQDRWAASQPLFRIDTGVLTIGAPEDGSDTGVRGWYDEVRVFAEEPHRELICNLARGTLAEVDPALDTPWRTIAQRRPAWVHQELDAHLAARGNPTAPLHACIVDHGNDRIPDPLTVPLGTTPIREAYIHPEGLLTWDEPRPDTTANPHCLSCHVDEPGRPASLTTAALTAAPIPVQHDPRRQPTQPPARLYGHIPADYAGAGRPARALVAPSYGCPIDALLLGPLPDDCWCDGAVADPDGDGVDDCNDPCPDAALDDVEPNGLCEGEDACIGDDATGDSDADGVCDSHDTCAGNDLIDNDGDGLPDDCDPCPTDPGPDLDGDGVCPSDDLCPGADDSAGCLSLDLSWHASADLDGDARWRELTGAHAGVDWLLTGATHLPVTTAHTAIRHAWAFDGGDYGVRETAESWASLPNTPTTGSATFETWFRVADPDTVGRELIWESGGASAGISFVLNGAEVQSWLTATDPVVAPLDVAMLDDFIQMVVVHDEAAQLLSLYLNGQFIMATPNTRGSWTGGNSPTLAGATEDSIGGNDRDTLDDVLPFRGDLAIVQVYNEARTAAQIAQQYDAVHCGFADPDGDGLNGNCDPCPLDAAGDSDGDGFCDSDDRCPDADDALDGDGDGVPDACDACPMDLLDDSDGDGVCDGEDRCPNADDTLDEDGDGIPDACAAITMVWDAAWATDTATWAELTGVYDGIDWALTGASLLRPVATGHTGIGGAMAFDGTGGGVGAVAWAALPDNPTNNAASIELWVRPADLDGTEILWESGGEQNGASIVLVDDHVETWLTNGGVAHARAPFPVSSDFVQILVIIHPATARLALYLDGRLADEVPTTANRWTGGNGPGIARSSAATTSIGGNWEGTLDLSGPFHGEVALFLLHERALSGEDIRDRYNLVSCGTAIDTDGDGLADPCDACPLDALDDSDGDGSCDSDDPCPGDDLADLDNDGVCDTLDRCPAGDDGVDTDLDGIADACDPCPLDLSDDTDGDGVCDSDESCPLNPDKLLPGTCGCDMADEDLNGDGIADCTVCGDGVVNAPETCDDGARVPGDGCSATCMQEALLLGAVQPGIAGMDNTFEVMGASPGGSVVIVVSNRLGATQPVPSCPQLTVPFAWSTMVGSASAGGDGRASYTRAAPRSIAGQGFAFIAIEPSSCRASNAVYTVF